MQTSNKSGIILFPHKKTGGDVCMEELYQKTFTIKKLKDYFTPYLVLLTKPSGKKLFLLLLAMMTIQFTTSINHLFKWFLSDICDISLNSYYYLLSYTAIPLDAFLKITVKLALSLITQQMYGLPVFLIIDDTLQAKFGTKFACYQTMFDHAKHGGNQYLKGHCFVAMTIGVPVAIGCKVRYLNVPVGFRLRGEGENKLKIASKMIECAMEVLASYPMAILLCDSWYPKGDVLKVVKKHANLELIANVRSDTSIFDLKPQRTGKPGRPATKGKQLDIHDDFHFIGVGDYFIAASTALTSLFGSMPVYLTVTTPDIVKHGAYRVFICTILPVKLLQQFKGYETMISDNMTSKMVWTFPLFLYSFRWAVEVFIYEQKTFWSFGLYRLRSKAGIENFVNFSALCYSCMMMLPHMDAHYGTLVNESPQTCKYLFGEAIRRELFLWRFINRSEEPINSDALFINFDVFGVYNTFLNTG